MEGDSATPWGWDASLIFPALNSMELSCRASGASSSMRWEDNSPLHAMHALMSDTHRHSLGSQAATPLTPSHHHGSERDDLSTESVFKFFSAGTTPHTARGCFSPPQVPAPGNTGGLPQLPVGSDSDPQAGLMKGPMWVQRSNNTAQQVAASPDILRLQATVQQAGALGPHSTLMGPAMSAEQRALAQLFELGDAAGLPAGLLAQQLGSAAGLPDAAPHRFGPVSGKVPATEVSTRRASPAEQQRSMMAQLGLASGTTSSEQRLQQQQQQVQARTGRLSGTLGRAGSTTATNGGQEATTHNPLASPLFSPMAPQQQQQQYLSSDFTGEAVDPMLGSMELGGLAPAWSAEQQLLEAAMMGAATSASLYVKNLPPDADELLLYQKFAPHGALLSCKVQTDPATGRCRGVGFVNFADQASALRAMHELHGTRISEGRALYISLQAPRSIRAAAAAAGKVGPGSGSLPMGTGAGPCSFDTAPGSYMSHPARNTAPPNHFGESTAGTAAATMAGAGGASTVGGGWASNTGAMMAGGSSNGGWKSNTGRSGFGAFVSGPSARN